MSGMNCQLIVGILVVSSKSISNMFKNRIFNYITFVHLDS